MLLVVAVVLLLVAPVVVIVGNEPIIDLEVDGDVELLNDEDCWFGGGCCWCNLNKFVVESSFLGGNLSFTLSRVLASSNEIFFFSSVSLPIITLA